MKQSRLVRGLRILVALQSGRQFRIDDLIDMLSVSRRTVYRLIAEGQVIAMKVRGGYRILESSIDSYISRQIFLHSLETGLDVSDFLPNDDTFLSEDSE